MSSKTSNATIRVLMVEDNPVDVDLLSTAFKELGDWPVDTVVAYDGEKAIKLLQRAIVYPEERPDLVILDLNLPRRDGTEVLQMIRNTDGLSNLLVAVFSSSPLDVIEERLTLAGVTANGHFSKPHSFNAFLKLGETLREWYEGQQPRSRTSHMS